MDIGALLRTLFCRLLFISILPIFLLLFLICSVSTKGILVDNRLYKFVARCFYWFIIKLSFVPITYKGIENIPEQPIILVANHQSAFDIPLIGYLLRQRPHIWLAWKELLSDKYLRFILPRISIPVDTTTPLNGMRTLVQAIAIIKEKTWDLIIFPEGGRFIDNRIHQFMAGYAVIARKTQRPVIPVKIIGVNRVYPPDSFIIHRYPITVIIGKPMIMQHDETDEAFNQRVYEWFVQTKE